MANDSEEIQVWYVSPDTEGKNNRIVFDDSDARYTSIVFDDKDKAIDFAHEVLDRLFDKLGADDCETMTISSGKITRGEYNEIIEATNGQP
jgi:hypothetical protein